MTTHDTAPFSIRPAANPDWRAARILLPNVIHFACGFELAIAEANQKIIAAAALDPIVRPHPVKGQRLALHVISPWQKRGIATALIQWAAHTAQQRGSIALFSWSSVLPDSPMATIWRALGFNHVQPHPHTHLDVDATVAYLQAAEPRLNRRCKAPATTRIFPLRQATPAHRSAAARLQMTHLGGDATAVSARFDPDFPDAADPDFSHILTMEDRVIGLALVRRISPNSAYIQSDVVDPQFRRGGWANFLLKLIPARACQRGGMRTFVFETFHQHADSRRFAQKVGGTTVQRVDLYRLIGPTAK